MEHGLIKFVIVVAVVCYVLVDGAIDEPRCLAKRLMGGAFGFPNKISESSGFLGYEIDHWISCEVDRFVQP